MADSMTTRCLGLVAVKQAQTWHCTVTKHLHFDLIYLKDFFPNNFGNLSSRAIFHLEIKRDVFGNPSTMLV